jgi:hypothetical protein
MSAAAAVMGDQAGVGVTLILIGKPIGAWRLVDLNICDVSTVTTPS